MADDTNLTEFVVSRRTVATCLSRVMSPLTMKPKFLTDDPKETLASPALVVLWLDSRR